MDSLQVKFTDDWPVNGIVFSLNLPRNLCFCRSIQIPLFKLMCPLLALSYSRDKYSSSSRLRIACPFLAVWSPNSPGLQTAWQSPTFRFGFWLQKDLFPTSRPWPRYLLSLELCFLIYKKGVVISILRTPWVVVRMKWNYVKITWKRQEPCRWPLCRCVLLNTTIQLYPFYLVIFISVISVGKYLPSAY